MFVFNKSSSAKTRTLGLLRMNIVHKKLVADEEGYFRLFTNETKISPKMGKRHNFKIKPEFGGNLFLFSTKFGLFKFLVSEDAAEIDHLQFDKTKIENCDKQEIYNESLDLVRDGMAENEKGGVKRMSDRKILELERKNVELERKNVELERKNSELEKKIFCGGIWRWRQRER
eukprot:GFUD01035096.1.p1 GENE.GFUD01035096.1~~GFUD01035096.1.p1  ORF type:complete len:191 (+),score=70.88 GFUD01035096.1:55-573(+)